MISFQFLFLSVSSHLQSQKHLAFIVCIIACSKSLVAERAYNNLNVQVWFKLGSFEENGMIVPIIALPF